VIYAVASNFYNLKNALLMLCEQLFQKKRSKSLQVQGCSDLCCGEQLLQPKKCFAYAVRATFSTFFIFAKKILKNFQKFSKKMAHTIMLSIILTHFYYFITIYALLLFYKNIFSFFFIFFRFFRIFKTQKLFRFFSLFS
jgi:hypothetical protein